MPSDIIDKVGADWRGDPSVLWPEARSVLVLAENYGPSHDPRDVLGRPAQGAISVYAQNRDYHDVVKKRQPSQMVS